MAWLPIEFPKRISMGAISTPIWEVSISVNQGQYEQRNLIASSARHEYDVSQAVRNKTDYAEVVNHFHMARGRLHSFPFKDPVDNRVEQSQGVLELRNGTFQAYKRYGTGQHAYSRKITRIKEGTAAVYSSGTPVTADVDSDTGEVYIAPAAVVAVLEHTPGLQHEVEASGLSPVPLVGGLVRLQGVTGTAATVLNAVHEVVAVDGDVLTLDINTQGLEAGGGTVGAQPSAASLSWSGEFYVPCRYNVPSLPAQVVDRQGARGELLIAAQSIMLIEVRE
jgi:uncharacterized protein (TIGR02217 family)